MIYELFLAFTGMVNETVYYASVKGGSCVWFSLHDLLRVYKGSLKNILPVLLCEKKLARNMYYSVFELLVVLFTFIIQMCRQNIIFTDLTYS